MNYDKIELIDIFFNEYCKVKCPTYNYCTKTNSHVLKCISTQNNINLNKKVIRK